ncbi:MAG: M23 family metallopeptidase [Nitrospira sp.]
MGLDKVTASASQTVGEAGGGVVLPGLATAFIPPGVTGNNPIAVEALSSPMMDALAPEATPGFEFLTDVPKFRVRTTQQPSEIIELAIAIPNLPALLPATHQLVLAMLTDSSESDEEAPSMGLTTIVGEVCEESTAVCVTLLPEWFMGAAGSSEVQVQIGIGRKRSAGQTVSLNWWDKLLMVAEAYAAEERWHLWVISDLFPSQGDIVFPDQAGTVSIGATVTLSSNVPSTGQPLSGVIMTSDFGPRDSANPSASKYHKGNDFRANEPMDVYSVMDGSLKALVESGKVRSCPDPSDPEPVQSKKRKVETEPEKSITIDSGSGAILTTYRHLSKILLSPEHLGQQLSGIFLSPQTFRIGLSGNTGTCPMHLHVEMEFSDSFGGIGKIDPWPILSNNVNRFVRDDLSDPVDRAPKDSKDESKCNGCREVFKFKLRLSLADGIYRDPGSEFDKSLPLARELPWADGELSRVVAPIEGTFNLGPSAAKWANGKHSLRLSLCSPSIGGCRKLKDWKINGVLGTWSGTASATSSYSGVRVISTNHLIEEPYTCNWSFSGTISMFVDSIQANTGNGVIESFSGTTKQSRYMLVNTVDCSVAYDGPAEGTFSAVVESVSGGVLRFSMSTQLKAAGGFSRLSRTGTISGTAMNASTSFSGGFTGTSLLNLTKEAQESPLPSPPALP